MSGLVVPITLVFSELSAANAGLSDFRTEPCGAGETFSFFSTRRKGEGRAEGMERGRDGHS
jgi:hypothetical protein